MKKTLILVAILFLGTFAFCKDNLVGFDIGICSGVPFYGSEYVTDANNDVNDGNFNRIIIGADADIYFKLGEPLKLQFGTDLLCDFIWNGSDYSNHIDYAFWGGIKVYPGLGGLNASLAYALGRRTDFLNTEVEDSVVHSSAWGNGFRLGLEYDFLHNSERSTLPAVGFYYRMMPRGNNDYDNILAVYLNMVF